MAEITLLNTEEVKAIMDKRTPDAYTLLDVRQEWEYEAFHLPGAQLIPLADLMDRVDELNTTKSIIAYCRSGARSMGASKLLQGLGLEHVANMVGGVLAWQGNVAFGPMELGLIEFTGQESPAEIVIKAYAMETSLQRFYIQRADMAETLERIELFMELAGFEDKHKETLFTLYTKLNDTPANRDNFEKTAFGSTELTEGGVDIEKFLKDHGKAFETDHGVLQLASMIEAQALDFYLRCSRQAQNPETQKVLQTLAREEKAHLKLLAKFMDKRQP